jgi:hypothetical protein
VDETHQLPGPDIHTPYLRATRPCGVGLETDISRYDNEYIACSLGNSKATIGAREFMQSLGGVIERIHFVYRIAIERCTQNIAVSSDGQILDPCFVRECPQRGDRIAVGWTPSECSHGSSENGKNGGEY